jgi:hypothetical protein
MGEFWAVGTGGTDSTERTAQGPRQSPSMGEALGSHQPTEKAWRADH